MIIPLHRALRTFLLLASMMLVFNQPLQRDARAQQAVNAALTIVYPGEDAKLPYVLKSFIFGAAPAGSTVSVNGVSALVAPSGGWIAYVPFQSGRFTLHVIARRGSQVFTADRFVDIASPPSTTPATPAHTDERVPPAPQYNFTLEPGDAVHLLVKASTAAHVTARMAGMTQPVPLAETSAAALSPSDKEHVLGDAVSGGETVFGLYQGQLKIPLGASGSQVVTYSVTARDGTTATLSSKGTVTVVSPQSRRVGTIVLEDHRKDIDARPYGIVESEPDGGWLFFPQAGTPFEITGSAGDYYRVALGTNEQGWIDKKSLQLAPDGMPAPHAQVEDVVVRDEPRTSSVTIHLSARVPYSVDEFAEGPSLRVRLYGASASTDYVRYGADRSTVRSIRWDQLSGDIATVEINLRQHTLWGYHAFWNGNDIKLVIKKPPHFAPAPAAALRGLLVVIDPGHSPDTGAIGPLGTLERDVNLAISKQLSLALGRLGARAMLTRYANLPVGLYDRTELAARVNADILISVHNNALPDGADPFTHHGYSVYYYQPQSLELARAIHASYGEHTTLADYGLYYDNLALARPTEEPAVLTESAFLMWPPEEMLLRSPSFQSRLAATLAAGLERWAESQRTKESGR